MQQSAIEGQTRDPGHRASKRFTKSTALHFAGAKWLAIPRVAL